MEINKENQNKKRLGRGLGSLLGGSVADNNEDVFTSTPIQNLNQNINQTKTANIASPQNVVAEDLGDKKVWMIAVDKLVPGIYQPRKNFDKESLQELANSIKENGIIQPITVRKRKEGGFEILAGERRWRASQIAGLHEVPAIIKVIGDREALQLALIENVQREDLDPVEEADSYQKLMEEFSLSQQEVADKVGKERSTVANALRLLSLPYEIKEMLAKKQISVGHAKAILSLTDKARQIGLAKKAIDGGLSVRAVENEIKSLQKVSLDNITPATGTDSALKKDLAGKLAADLADQLQKALGTKVEINYKKGKGQVMVHFYSDDQLTTVFEKLKG